MKTAHKPSILVVDDEAIVRLSLRDWFTDEGCDVDVAENAAEALRAAAGRPHDIALIDIKMPGMDGLELQARLAEKTPDLTVIMMTAYASVETAVGALKAGAYDYIVKPFDPDELTHLVERASEHRALRAENVMLKQRLAATSDPAPIIGTSPATSRVLQLVDTVAPADTTVLVLGESGTGKELVAQAIHARSPRRFNPLVAVHCGALAEGVLESELFGHEKGAFTGARYPHKGIFEQAEGGSIFLDEIGDIGPRVQVDLLRVLEERVVTRVGGKRSIPVDFRIIAATNRDLEGMVHAGKFRDDLYWRLNVVSIEIPPLRDRREDIAELAGHFLQHFGRTMNRKDLHFAPEALERLESHDWPGNVRELRNYVERAVVLGQPPTIEAHDLPIGVAKPASRATPSRHLADVERTHIEEVLEEQDWNISQAARLLGVDRGTLYNKIKKHGLSRHVHGA
ncbi:MAG: sigma-54-dependent transcriptional regulator [Planctomycetota bacterium]|jgi:DNA-binding NtrC family response regulator